MLMLRGETRPDLDPQETAEWLEALDQIAEEAGPDRVNFLLDCLEARARDNGVGRDIKVNTPYINTIAPDNELAYPGNEQLELELEKLIRWNAMAMVVRANKHDSGIGGHISTYASLATLAEVGYHHFFRAKIGEQFGDMVYYQGHASPGLYSRAYLEGRLNDEHLTNFRHELRDHPGLSSYPHPWLMPDFWQFPTVSMGLGPINAIYHARFLRYMEHRGLMEPTDRKVWAFIGDGETGEPETLGALNIAAYERLDNLCFVVNCNLQRLDGPVRGNGKIIQELEGVFRGAGWNVIKLIWGRGWDELLEKDDSGKLIQLMEECVDGDYQRFKSKGGECIRDEFFGRYPETAALVDGWTPEEINEKLLRGGHDPRKIYNAYKQATEHTGQPTVILAKTVKGYGMGEAGEGKNITHQQKKMNEAELDYVRQRFSIPISDEHVKEIGFFRPERDEEHMAYLHERREELGGYLPARTPPPIEMTAPALESFKDSLGGSKGREVSTTMAFVAVLKSLLADKTINKYVVPIIPDEARTFGMESLFRTQGIYSSRGQVYKPVDSEMLLYYKESQDGQVLEEGISEAGAMASFTAAGTAYANLGVPMIPFFIYYSMFGFQRVGDMIWAFADSRGKGFLCGGTAGRTTLAGEGLQHQDGHSIVIASTVPTCVAYDPAYAYEIAVIVRDGIRRMYEEQEDCFYYLTLENDNYVHPEMPEGAEEGILKGIYQLSPADGDAAIHLWGSGAILGETLKAQALLKDEFGIAANVYSVTSYTELRKEALETERWNRLHPSEKAKTAHIAEVFAGDDLPIVAASDYMKVLPDGLSPWLGGRLSSLGTDGFGRSENREHLRRFFEVDAKAIAAAAISRLARDGKFDKRKLKKAFATLEVDTAIANPATR